MEFNLFLISGLKDRFNFKQKEMSWSIELKSIQLEEELNRSIELYKEVQEINKGLELKVQERTEDIMIEKNNISAILNNMVQAVFAVEENGIIIPPI